MINNKYVTGHLAIFHSFLRSTEFHRASPHKKSPACFPASTDIPRKIMEEVGHGTRKRGRPNLCWRDGVPRDARRRLGVRNWMPEQLE